MPGRRASPSSRRPPRPSATSRIPSIPTRRVAAAASLLSSLERRFGNRGLAAAAYNARRGRVSAWLRKRKRLPVETRQYVKAITGRPASIWAKSRKKALSIVGKAEAETI